MELNPLLPFLIALASGLVFGLIAYRARRGYVIWGIGGAIFGVTLAATVVGIAHSISVPYSDEVIAKYYWIAGIISIVLIGLVAVAATLGYGRREPDAKAPLL